LKPQLGKENGVDDVDHAVARGDVRRDHVGAAKDGFPVNSDADWIIGAWGTSRNFLGTMDEIRFSNRVRSDAWIKLSYETQKAAATALTFGATQTPASLQDFSGNAGGIPWIDPSASGLVFGLPAGTGSALLTVVDMKGRVLWSREAELGAAASTVNRGVLPSGTYVARVILRANGTAERTVQRQFSVAR
jgi:hypothetical protein